MAVKPMRRLVVPESQSLYDVMSRQALHALYWRSDLEAVEREHPELIVRRDENVLALVPGGAAKLVYSYASDREFVERFPEMLDELLPRIRRVMGADSIRFRLTHSPSRPRIEPVLKSAWFNPTRDWMEFALPRGAALPKAAAPARVRFRDATPEDAGVIAEIDEASFPRTPVSLEYVRSRLADGRHSAIVATRGSDVVGFGLYSMPDPGEGFFSTLAVREDDRREGIGRALTLRVLRRLFADGAKRVSLTTDDDNTAAIRLYVSLGFRQERSGRDYTRPADPKRVEDARRAKQGTFIKFGGWR
jgi:[ribosomal protein S18]-alanine N-acetyltransferase